MSEFQTFTFGPSPGKSMDVDVWLSEDQVKSHIKAWLERGGWRLEVAWGKSRGTDILATSGEDRWLIEAKGGGSLQPMRVNYFLMILGEILQRLDYSSARYSIALPDMRQFRGLWSRLPSIAKARTGVTALFVAPNGEIDQTAA